MSDIPCRCGHSSTEHAKEFLPQSLPGDPIWENDACFDKGLNWKYCDCNKFVLDNLKLIEQLAQERNLV